jgi:hypothetical protein
MANTFVKIASVTVGSGGAASIDFTSIPGTYTDLVLKISGRLSVSDNFFSTKINGSLVNTSNRSLRGNGTVADSENWVDNFNIIAQRADQTANTFGNAEVYIPNYAGSAHKSMSIDSVNENNATFAYTFLNASLWSSTAAITELGIRPIGGGNITQYSTATLYGIKSS